MSLSLLPLNEDFTDAKFRNAVKTRVMFVFKYIHTHTHTNIHIRIYTKYNFIEKK